MVTQLPLYEGWEETLEPFCPGRASRTTQQLLEKSPTHTHTHSLSLPHHHCSYLFFSFKPAKRRARHFTFHPSKPGTRGIYYIQLFDYSFTTINLVTLLHPFANLALPSYYPASYTLQMLGVQIPYLPLYPLACMDVGTPNVFPCL